MAEIAGDWKEFEFYPVTEEDVSELCQFFRENYFPYEPVCQLTGYSEEFVVENERNWKGFIKDNLSFMSKDKESGKIAAVRLAYNHEKKDEEEFARNICNSENDPGSTSRETEAVNAEFRAMYAQSNVFDKYKIDRYMKLTLACVAPEYRKRGLMTEMYRRSIELARARGFKLVGCCFTSPFTRHAAQKLGFEEVARVRLMDLRDSAGVLYYPQATHETIVTQAVFRV